MAIYLDASALVKLVVAEPESLALRRFLARRPERVSSALSRVEVLRAVRGSGAAALARARALLSRLRLLRLDDALLDDAASLPPDILRSLDAVHLASARALGEDLEEVLTYDRRMLAAAAGLGLKTRSPGLRRRGG